MGAKENLTYGPPIPILIPCRPMAEIEQKCTILLIEDEQDFAMGLRDAFEFEGYELTSASSGEAGIATAADLHPDLIILDLMLPGMNGYQVCEQIRRRDKVVPILILSARSQESDIIRGLEAGADDYVTKPFSIGELLARVRTIFRRVSVSQMKPREKIEIGDVTVDVESQTAQVNGKPVSFGFYEIAMLQLLHENRGTPVSRDDILDTVWGIDANPTNRTIDNFILKLRRKLEPNPAAPKYILTVYGQGYKLV
ncbi:MAG: response regulator transcription factor [Myxococcota bacterium]|nr:response regulator transcription factor [Myxococcota bacterium]